MRIKDIKSRKCIIHGDFCITEIIDDIVINSEFGSSCLILFKTKQEIKNSLIKLINHPHIEKISRGIIFTKADQKIYLWVFSEMNSKNLHGLEFEYVCGIDIDLDFSCLWHNIYLTINRTHRNTETSFKLFLSDKYNNINDHSLLNISNFRRQNVFKELHFAKNK